VNNNPLPGTASFNWNWMEPSEVGDHSGTISINRNTLANFYNLVLTKELSKYCVQIDFSFNEDGIATWKYLPGQKPVGSIVVDQGSRVLRFDYSCKQDDETPKHGHRKLSLTNKFTCYVYFGLNQNITISRFPDLYVYQKKGSLEGSGHIYKKRIVNYFELSINQDGKLQLKANGNPVVEDLSEEPDVNWWASFWTKLDESMEVIQEKMTHYMDQQITETLPITPFENFIFPGANVFAYKDVSFSEHQDLISHITYVKPK